MTSWAVKQVLKVFGENKLEGYMGPEDPWFEYIPASRLSGKHQPGEFKKVRKALPPGLSDHDAKILKKVRRRAWKLDACIGSCCGNRFGISAIIGLIPFVGDAFNALLSLIVVRTACKVEGGLPFGLKLKMLILVALNFGVGLVPILGDMADAVFKANQRNAMILERHLRQKGKKALKARGLPYPDNDPSRGEEFDRSQSDVTSQYVETQPARQPSMKTRRGQPTAPAPAKVRGDGRSKSWFNRGSTKSRNADLETGITNT